MPMKKDDWPKPRSKGQHLTEAEIAEIKQSFVDGNRVEYIARKLQCSSRVVSKYYGFFRAEGIRQREKKKKPLPRDRFYKSDFSI
jgi:hypothetical protein